MSARKTKRTDDDQPRTRRRRNSAVAVASKPDGTAGIAPDTPFSFRVMVEYGSRASTWQGRPTMRVGEIAETYGFRRHRNHPMFIGDQWMEPTKTLADYGVGEGSVVHCKCPVPPEMHAYRAMVKLRQASDQPDVA